MEQNRLLERSPLAESAAVTVAPQPLGTTLALCLREARPVVQVIYQLRFVTGVALAGTGALARVGHVLAAMVTWFCVGMFVYLINGVTDVEEDRRNGSRRPIASGALPLGNAVVATVTCAMLASVGGVLLGRAMSALVTGMLLLGYTYSAPPFAFKRRSSTTAFVGIAAGVGAYVAGILAAGGAVDPAMVIFASAMSAWLGLVGAQAKDLSDVPGDRAAGRRTMAVRLGESPVRRLIAASSVLIGSLFLLAAFALAPYLIPAAVVVQIGGIVLAATVRSRHSTGDRHQRRRPYRLFMLTQYGAHGALIATVLLRAL